MALLDSMRSTQMSKDQDSERFADFWPPLVTHSPSVLGKSASSRAGYTSGLLMCFRDPIPRCSGRSGVLSPLVELKREFWDLSFC